MPTNKIGLERSASGTPERPETLAPSSNVEKNTGLTLDATAGEEGGIVHRGGGRVIES